MRRDEGKMNAKIWMGVPVATALFFGAGCDKDGGGQTPPPGEPCEAVVQDPAFLCSVEPPSVSMALSAQGHHFYDELNRHVVLRGVNAGGRSKLPPFFPFPFAESGYENQAGADTFEIELERYVDKIVEWGHNVVRLPFSWEAVEPEQGTYDTVYMARLVRFSEHLSERGVRVILDFHQDVFSRAYCGDGFPLWASSEPDRPIPAIEDCADWFWQYLTASPIDEEFARFWRNDDNLRDQFLAMWQYVIEETRHIEGVVGYEMLNEPYEGAIATAEWVEDYYVPLVEEFSQLVETEAPGRFAVFGSPGTDTLNGETKVTRPDGENLAFGPHFYDPIVYIMGTPMGRWNPKLILEPFFQTLIDWDMPGFVGESGCRTKLDKCDAYIRAVYEDMDRYPWNVTTWEYSATVDDWNNEGFGLVDFGGVERPAANEVVRTYPQAIAGSFESFVFDRTSGSATLTYDAVADGITEIRVPTRIYEEAPVIIVEEGEACGSWDAQTQSVYLRAASAGKVSVRIERAVPDPVCD